jgi:predicted Ser/Thr protein kinase
MSEMPQALAYERVKIDSLQFDPRNARKHDDRNIKAIMDSLSKFGQQKAIVVGDGGVVIAGNGTLEAAKRLGWDTIDIRRSGLKADEATAYAIADNRSAELAEWDDPVLGDILGELKESGWELDDLGFNDEEFKQIEKEILSEKSQENLDDLYTKKIEAPIYKPTGQKPQISDLYDRNKFKELIEEIKLNDKLTDDVRDFLQYAATRHLIFNYQNIAEFYAHSDKETQELMEKSALVIIDFDKAIENGFVKMTKDLAEAYDYEG